MKYSKFFKFLEKKDHLINKLTALTPEQKQEVTTFFTKHPNYESEIDWNRKDLTWDDFEEVMNKERISASQLRNFVKENKHYLLLYKSKNLVAYQPLTWLGSRYIASDDVAPYVEGKWCTAYQKDIVYWNRYSFDKKRSFLYLCTPTTKWALEIDIFSKEITPWDVNDNSSSIEDFYERIFSEVPNIKEILKELISQAIDNYNLVVDSREIDERDNAILEKNRELVREAQIKAFPKSFPRQVRRKGYYQWDGDLCLEDLEKLGLYDKETGFFDEKVSKFKVIGNVDFIDCSSKNIYLPLFIKESFTLFRSKNFKSVVLPEGITSIGIDTFYECRSLTSITIPDSVKRISSGAFHRCLSLTSINIPNSVREIAGYAFCDCKSLTSITIPNSVKEIGQNAFDGCTSLTEITLPDSVKEIGNYAFSECKSLTSINLPKDLTKIGRRTFYYCNSLKSVVIPERVTRIEEEAFLECSDITSITIPNSVDFIGNNAFFRCESLKTVYIDKGKDSLDISKAKVSPQTEIYWKGEF